MTGPVIGRQPTSNPTPAPTKTANPVLGGLGDAISKAAANTKLNIKADVLSTVGTINFVSSLTKAQVQQITPWLKKFGASKSDLSTVGNAKKYLQNNYNTYIENSGGSLTKLIQLFKNDYIPTSDASTASATGNGVTQYITQKSPALVKQNVDKFLLDTIGSTNIKPESRKAIMDEVQKLIDAGTTTTSKMDKSGKTTVVQTAGYSDERAGAVVAEKAKTLEPEKYQQQQQATFFDFLQKAEQMRGGR
jgi:hypothetical protein